MSLTQTTHHATTRRIQSLLPTATDDVLATCEAVGLSPDDVAADIQRIRTGAATRADLLAQCQDGAAAEDGTAEEWANYVSDVCLAAGVSR